MQIEKIYQNIIIETEYISEVYTNFKRVRQLIMNYDFVCHSNNLIKILLTKMLFCR